MVVQVHGFQGPWEQVKGLRRWAAPAESASSTSLPFPREPCHTRQRGFWVGNNAARAWGVEGSAGEGGDKNKMDGGGTGQKYARAHHHSKFLSFLSGCLWASLHPTKERPQTLEFRSLQDVTSNRCLLITNSMHRPAGAVAAEKARMEKQRTRLGKLFNSLNCIFLIL